MLQVSVQTAVECEYLNTERRVCECSTVCVKILATCLKARCVSGYVFVYGFNDAVGNSEYAGSSDRRISER